MINAASSTHLYVFAPDASLAGTGEIRQKRSLGLQKAPAAI